MAGDDPSSTSGNLSASDSRELTLSELIWSTWEFSLAQDRRKSLEKERSLELRAEDAVDDDEDEHETAPLGLALLAVKEEQQVADDEQEDLEGE